MSRFRLRINRRGASELLHSKEVGEFLMQKMEPVAAFAKLDPNADYSDGIEQTLHHSPSRVSARVGAAPGIGMAVEAKRGTLARGLGNA